MGKLFIVNSFSGVFLPQFRDHLLFFEMIAITVGKNMYPQIMQTQRFVCGDVMVVGVGHFPGINYRYCTAADYRHRAIPFKHSAGILIDANS